jgi:hypothetical protein
MAANVALAVDWPMHKTERPVSVGLMDTGRSQRKRRNEEVKRLFVAEEKCLLYLYNRKAAPNPSRILP